MSRGPTPPQMCLLLLMDIYCNGHVPQDGRLPVLAFIASHLLPQGALTSRDIKHVALRQNNLDLDSLKDLLEPLKSATGPKTLWEEFLEQLCAINNLDDWFEFLFNSTCLFSKPNQASGNQNITVIATQSLFGTGIRQVFLDFKRIDFQVALQCWKAFEHFTSRVRPHRLIDKGSSERQLGVPLSSKSQSVMDGILKAANPSDPGLSNATDVEKLLSFQIDSMQKLGNRLPQDMLTVLETNMSRSQHSANLINYVEFLDAWYAGDYPTSFEKLHRYYDYAMLNKDRSQYQYALLNTAILLADFGCRREAMAAMQETVLTARENKDVPCLNFSMSWLYHFSTIYGDKATVSSSSGFLTSDVRSLEFLKSRAQESKMWSVVSATLLNEARLFLAQGHRPGIAVDRIYESSFLNVRHGIRGMKCAQAQAEATLYSRLGISSLAVAHRTFVVSNPNQDVPLEDLIRARCQTSFALALTGRYKEARVFLEQCKPEAQRSLKCQQLIQVTSNMVTLKHLLHRNELDLAESHVEAAVAAPFLDKDISFEIAMLELDFLDRQSDFDAALSKLEQLADGNKDDNHADVAHRMRLMNRKASIAARLGKPQKGLSLSFRSLVAALEARLVPLICEAAAGLAGVLISLRELDAAEEVLSAVACTAQELGDAFVLATIQDKRAATALARAKSHKPGESRSRQLRNCYVWSEKALTTYNSLEDTMGRRFVTERCLAVSIQLGNNQEVEKHRASLKALDEESARRAPT